jgi:hypothetical protein
MKPHHLFVPLSLLLTALAVSDLRAEEWPSLDRYASNCVLVVKARQVGNFSDKEDSKLTFEVVETWKGRFDQRDFTGLSPEGYIQAAQGEHGVRVTAGQEIVFFFTRHNQPEGKLRIHSTAFPIRTGRVVYAITGEPGIRQEMSVEEFKRVFDRFKTKP